MGIRIRDRVVELRRIPASELIPNPKNWRTHPGQQRSALAGLLNDIGYADALLARETANGLLRAETTHGAVIPVLVLDVTEQQADKLLAALDSLLGMAEYTN